MEALGNPWRLLEENASIGDGCFAVPVDSICAVPAGAEEEQSSLWYVGVIVSIVGSVLSNFGVNTQKYSMIQEIRNGRERPYVKQPLWMMGMLMVFIGAVADFGALGFAAQSLITPVGGFTMVANLFFASYWLGEKITKLDFVSTMAIVGGIVLVAAFADKSTQCFTLDILKCLYTREEFIGYAVMVGGLIVLVYGSIKVSRRRMAALVAAEKTSTKTYRRLRMVSPLLHASLSGLIGAQSVLFAKSTIEILKSTANGQNEFKSFETYLIILAMLVAIFGQIHWLAIGLEQYDAVIMVPVFQCVFVVFTIIGGASYFGEFRSFNKLQTIFFPLGVLMLVIGVLGLARHKSRDAEELLNDSAAKILDMERGDSFRHKGEGADSEASSNGDFWDQMSRRGSIDRYREFSRLSPYGAVTGRWIPLEFLLSEVDRNVERVTSFLQRVNSSQQNTLPATQSALTPEERNRRRSSVPTRMHGSLRGSPVKRADSVAEAAETGAEEVRFEKASSFAGIESLLMFNSRKDDADVKAGLTQGEDFSSDEESSSDEDDTSSL